MACAAHVEEIFLTGNQSDGFPFSVGFPACFFILFRHSSASVSVTVFRTDTKMDQAGKPMEKGGQSNWLQPGQCPFALMKFHWLETWQLKILLVW